MEEQFLSVVNSHSLIIPSEFFGTRAGNVCELIVFPANLFHLSISTGLRKHYLIFLKKVNLSDFEAFTRSFWSMQIPQSFWVFLETKISLLVVAKSDDENTGHTGCYLQGKVISSFPKTQMILPPKQKLLSSSHQIKHLSLSNYYFQYLNKKLNTNKKTPIKIFKIGSHIEKWRFKFKI